MSYENFVKVTNVLAANTVANKEKSGLNRFWRFNVNNIHSLEVHILGMKDIHRLIIADCLVNVVYMAINTFVQSPWTIVGKQEKISNIREATEKGFFVCKFPTISSLLWTLLAIGLNLRGL